MPRKFFLTLLSGLLLFILYLIFSPGKYWDGKGRLAVAFFDRQEGDVTLVVFDPQTNSRTTIEVPGNLEVDVSRNLGTWRLESVWQLGVNEKVGGVLLSETLTKSLTLPIESFATGSLIGFTSDLLPDRLSAVMGGGKTNLNLKDRLGIFFFLLGLGNSDSLNFTMEGLGAIAPARLVDGGSGYKLRGSIPAKLSGIFADALISKEGLKISLSYPQGKEFQAKKVSAIVEALGAKVIALKKTDSSLDCTVSGGKTLTKKKLAELFSCKAESKTPNPYDLEIEMGEEFFNRF